MTDAPVPPAPSAPRQDAVRVALDATSLLEPQTGVGRVTDALVSAYATRADIECRSFAISARRGRRLPNHLPVGADWVKVPFAAQLVRPLWRRFDAPSIDRFIGDVDVVHGPNFVVPPTSRPRIATVHDLTPVHYPELAHPWTLQYPDLLRVAYDAGAWVHTVSDAVRDDVLDTFGFDAARVVTVPNGFTPIHGDALRGHRLTQAAKYVLAVGTVEPRKGLPDLLAAIDILAADDPDLILVHAGPDGWGRDQFDAALAKMRHPERIRRLGRVGDRALADLYAGAAVFAYPSRYEGFGLPILEAMSAGLPVVTTNVPALSEVAGEAASVVPVGDTAALADEIDRCWRDASHAQRLVAAGTERARQFSWEACADGMVSLYRQVANAPR